jgi:hypothetical protein
MTIPLFDLIGDRAIKRGATYKRFTIGLSGDKRTWDARGSIRDNTKENDGTLILEWQFLTSAQYDAESDLTIFFPSLTVEDTTNELLLPTKYQSESGTLKIGNALLTDFEFESPELEVIATDVVWVQVKSEVT